jgi:prevent-host-death family protein
MKQITRSVPVAELKARLSEYLRMVRRGHEVIVTDRGRPVARLSPVGPSTGFDALISEGVARAPQRDLPEEFWTLPRVKDPAGRLLEVLLEERAEDR